MSTQFLRDASLAVKHAYQDPEEESNAQAARDCHSRCSDGRLAEVLEWIIDQKGLLGWLATLSFVTFVGTLIAIPLLVARIPEDYFVRRRRHRLSWWEQHPALRVVSFISKNAFGSLFIAAGLVMLVLPGQGMITIVVGLLLIDFPGKFRLERWLAGRRRLMRGINWIRLRSGRPPLLEPKRLRAGAGPKP